MPTILTDKSRQLIRELIINELYASEYLSEDYIYKLKTALEEFDSIDVCETSTTFPALGTLRER